MKRILKKTLIAFLVLSKSVTCFAYDESVKDRADIASWAQATWSGVYEDTAVEMIKPGGSHTIGAAACGLFSLSYARVKAGELTGTKEKEFMDTIQRVRDKDAFRSEGPDWLVDYTRTEEICDDLKLATIDGVTMDRTAKTFSSGSDILKDIASLYEKGYYVIACVVNSYTAGHYIFMDQPIDGGKDFIIGDSGFPGSHHEINNGSVLKFSDMYSPSDINHITVLESRKGVKANEQPSIYTNSVVADKLGVEKGKSNKSEGSENNEKTAEEKAKEEKELSNALGLKDEWELVGMSDLKGMISDGAFMFDMPDSIDNKYKENVELIKVNIDDRKNTIWGWLRAIVKSLGIFLLAYTTLFVGFYVFDRVNTILDFSLLSVLTLGRYRVYKKDEVSSKAELHQVKSAIYLDFKGMLLRCVIMFLISWAIISGSIYEFGQFLYTNVANRLG